MSTTKLYVFTISHYCEKARWAFSALGVEHELIPLSPIEYFKVANKLGLKTGSVPFISTDIPTTQVIQGSAKIIDWADRQQAGGPTLGSDVEEVVQIEQRLDATLGVQVRRLFYSEALVSYPKSIHAIFAHGLPLMDKLKLRLAWPKVRSIMIQRMDLGADQFEDALQQVETELDWLDSLLGAGNDYLYGNKFSRADIAAASLLAPIASPANHPAAELISLPPQLAALARDWQARPFFQWIDAMYSKHRV